MIILAFCVIPLTWFVWYLFVIRIIIKFQNELHQHFPDRAVQILGAKKAFGLINKKMGLLFLWNREVKSLTITDEQIEKQRKFAANCVIISCVIILLTPGFMFLFYWLAITIGSSG